MSQHQFLWHHRERGFTMVELMVTISIGMILMAIAVPGLEELIDAQRVKGFAYELVSDLTLARSEALKRGQNVTLTPSSTGWGGGWTVTTTQTSPSLAVIQLSQKNLAGTGVTFTQSPSALTFDNNGRLAGASTTTRFGFGDRSSHQRCISIDPTGRAKSANTPCPA
jgi:type IV fimbrial biogenesis protein FimT